MAVAECQGNRDSAADVTQPGLTQVKYRSWVPTSGKLYSCCGNDTVDTMHLPGDLHQH